MRLWRRAATPENPLPKGHPFRFQPSLASATGSVTLRHVGVVSALGAPRPTVEATGRGMWVVVGSALCFAEDRPSAGGIMGLAELMWAEWQWIEQFEVDGPHVRVRFRTGRERSTAEYREVELEADDATAVEELVRTSRRFL